MRFQISASINSNEKCYTIKRLYPNEKLHSPFLIVPSQCPYTIQIVNPDGTPKIISTIRKYDYKPAFSEYEKLVKNGQLIIMYDFSGNITHAKKLGSKVFVINTPKKLT